MIIKRFLFLLLLFVALNCHGAAGDFVGASINSDGWQIWLEFAGMHTNGGFGNFGFGTNNSITGAEKIKLSVTSPGFSSSGTETTFTRILYGTKQVRMAYPLNIFPETTSNAVSTTVRFALSDYVYLNDSNITVTVATGLYYTNSITNAAALSMPVTNNSLRAYPLPVANWTWPGFIRETGTTMRLRAVGFCQTADNGAPLAGMRFIVSQTNGVTTTNWVSTMAFDRTLPDAVPSSEYFTDVELTPFTNYISGGQNGLLRCNFEAVPRLGTTVSIKSTTDGNLTPQAATLTNLCDRLATYCNHIAVVDPNGNDTNGRATNTTPANVSSTHYFASIRGAAARIASTNNSVNGHNDPGGGIIYVRAGITNWAGAAGDITTTPAAWLDIRPYPGDTVSPLTTQSGTFYVGHRVKLTSMDIGGGLAGNLFFGVTGMWWDRCTISSTSVNLMRTALWFATHCNTTNMAQGFGYAGNVMPALIRGNTVGDQVGSYWPVHVVMGNLQTSNTLATIKFDSTVPGQPRPYGAILYNNRFNFHISGNNQRITGMDDFDMNSAGAAIIQNVFECSTNNVAPLFSWGALTKTVSNLLVWNNVFVGQRINFCYNWTGAPDTVRDQVQCLNNLSDNFNLKTDLTATTTSSRTNNWQQLFGVSWQANCWMETTNASAAPTDNLPSNWGGFVGLNTVENRVKAPPNWPQFINRQAYDGTATHSWPGDGNYRVTSSAPQQGLGSKWVLPYDIEGNFRGNFDPPGAYSSASPRRGGGFF